MQITMVRVFMLWRRSFVVSASVALNRVTFFEHRNWMRGNPTQFVCSSSTLKSLQACNSLYHIPSKTTPATQCFRIQYTPSFQAFKGCKGMMQELVIVSKTMSVRKHASQELSWTHKFFLEPMEMLLHLEYRCFPNAFFTFLCTLLVLMFVYCK
jgi:hypothetical protein